MDYTLQIAFFIFIILGAIVHEYCHGWMADQLGDPTARDQGRLTLNPLAHIDPMGSLLLPAFAWWATNGRFLFAYAKPVPFNPDNLRYQKWGPALVGVAGPAANIVLALMLGAVIRLFGYSEITSFLAVGVEANVVLAVFNLVPIPPLDGSKILFSFFPDSWRHIQAALDRYGFILFFVFIFSFSHLLSPLMDFLYRIIVY